VLAVIELLVMPPVFGDFVGSHLTYERVRSGSRLFMRCSLLYGIPSRQQECYHNRKQDSKKPRQAREPGAVNWECVAEPRDCMEWAVIVGVRLSREIDLRLMAGKLILWFRTLTHPDTWARKSGQWFWDAIATPWPPPNSCPSAHSRRYKRLLPRTHGTL
jgi:hypothetical protein